MPAQGAYRTDVRMDVQRWEGFGKIQHPTTKNWMNCTLDSWSTMRECLKGFEVVRNSFCGFDIHHY